MLQIYTTVLMCLKKINASQEPIEHMPVKMRY